jgi:DNA-binding Lrp family transcriptional regulator
MPAPREIERAIVLVLLSEAPVRRRSRGEVARELRHLPPAEVGAAIVRLGVEGVLERRGEDVWPSRATRRLDELGLIAV